MSKRILKLEFYKNTPYRDIYEELKYHSENGILAECTINGITINNEDMTKVKDIITRLELGLTEQQYEEYKKNENENKYIFKLYCARSQTPYIIRYWIERGKQIISEDKREDWEKYCYLMISNAKDEEKQFYYGVIISAVKIMLKLEETTDEKEIYKVIDEELSYVYDNVLMDLKFTYLEIIINEFYDKGEIYNKLIFYDEVTNTRKFNNLKENKITMKRIPDYLKF